MRVGRSAPKHRWVMENKDGERWVTYNYHTLAEIKRHKTSKPIKPHFG